jgi:uncharacterized repeat protein (TIGR01451 family)
MVVKIMKKIILSTIAVAMALALVLVPVTPLSAAEIQGTKDVEPADPNQYAVGDTIHYVITVTNPGTIFDLVVDIWDDLPDGSTQILGVNVTITPEETKYYELDYVVKESDVQEDGGIRKVINKLSAEGIESDGQLNPPVEVYVEKSSEIIDVPVGGEAFSVSKFDTLVYCSGLITFLLLGMSWFMLKHRTI